MNNFSEFAAESNYYQIILKFFRKFSKEIQDQVDIDLIGKFIKALYQKTTEEIDSCAGDSEILQDSSSVKNCLDIFIEICKDKRTFGSFNQDINIILEDYCKKLLLASMKDRLILEYMFSLLKGHYEANKGKARYNRQRVFELS